jgi:hypothetical protein
MHIEESKAGLMESAEGFQLRRRGYRPTSDSLDRKNPPQGGSGLPSQPSEKKEERTKDKAIN